MALYAVRSECPTNFESQRERIAPCILRKVTAPDLHSPIK